MEHSEQIQILRAKNRATRAVYWDSMGTVRLNGDYKSEGDSLGRLIDGANTGFYELGGVLLPQGIMIGVATNGPGYPEVTDIFTALTEGKITTDASIDYRDLQEAEPLKFSVMAGYAPAISFYQSREQLSGEARKRAAPGLIAAVSEGGAKGHIFRDDMYSELVLCHSTIPEKLNDVKEELYKHPVTGPLMRYLTNEYTLNAVFTIPGASEDELIHVARACDEVADKVAPDMFKKTQIKPQNFRTYLIPRSFITDPASKYMGVLILHHVIGKPFSIGEMGYVADKILSSAEIEMMRDPYGRIAAFGIDIAPGISPDERYARARPEEHPDLLRVESGLDALALISSAFRKD